MKSKDVQDDVFGLARGRDGFSFVDCYNFQVVARIKEMYFIVYGKNEVLKSKLIGKDFVKGIIIEVMKGRKVSWDGFGHETHTNERSKWLSWMEKCIEKKANLVGKIVAQVETKLRVEHVMKGEKKVKQKFYMHSST